MAAPEEIARQKHAAERKSVADTLIAQLDNAKNLTDNASRLAAGLWPHADGFRAVAGQLTPQSPDAEPSQDAEPSPLDVQVGGSHYKNRKIQPVEYIHANNMGFLEGCIVKRITRWRDKNGYEDLEKIKHEIDLLIYLEDQK